MRSKQPLPMVAAKMTLSELPSYSNLSPLRYPGGKSSFQQYFALLVKKYEIEGGLYYEPFAGGSGVALSLLHSDASSVAMLNDADYHIYCFWQSALSENERFVERIKNTPVSIDEWKKQKGVYLSPAKHKVFDIGFSTFYLNRCNRSGILSGAGPIGGYRQDGKWRIDARFNKNELVKRVKSIGGMRERIRICNVDGIEFLKKNLPRGRERDNVLVFLDPPYVSAGSRLYLNLYREADHRRLANYLLGQKKLKWVLTYDDNNLVRRLYSSCQQWGFKLGYSLQSNRQGRELLIAPPWIELPNYYRYSGNKWHFTRRIKEN